MVFMSARASPRPQAALRRRAAFSHADQVLESKQAADFIGKQFRVIARVDGLDAQAVHDVAAADLVDVPRADLPFGLPDWHGAGGVRRSFRDGDDAIRWQAP
jgi:hypothetical protein